MTHELSVSNTPNLSKPTDLQLIQARQTMYSTLPMRSDITGEDLGILLSGIDRELDQRSIDIWHPALLRPQDTARRLPFERRKTKARKERLALENAQVVFHFLQEQPEIAYGVIPANIDRAFKGMIGSLQADNHEVPMKIHRTNTASIKTVDRGHTVPLLAKVGRRAVASLVLSSAFTMGSVGALVETQPAYSQTAIQNTVHHEMQEVEADINGGQLQNNLGEAQSLIRRIINYDLVEEKSTVYKQIDTKLARASDELSVGSSHNPQADILVKQADKQILHQKALDDLSNDLIGIELISALGGLVAMAGSIARMIGNLNLASIKKRNQ